MLSRSSCVLLFATLWTLSSVRGILQARILEWVAISFSKESSQPRDQICIPMSPALASRFFTNSTTWETIHPSVQFSSLAQSCPTLCDPMNHNTPGLPVHHQLPEFTQTHVHRVGGAIQPSHPLSSPSPAPDPSQHQGLFQWVNSLQSLQPPNKEDNVIPLLFLVVLIF